MTIPMILYTCRVDRQGPISTIHREVGKRLSKYRFTTFGNQMVSGMNETINVPNQMTIKNIPQLIRTYGDKYDIIHTGPRKRDYLAWLTTCRGATHVHTLHAAPNDPKTIKRERRFAAHADHVTVVSEFVKQWALNTLGIDEPITIIPNGVDLDIFKPMTSPSEQTFVFVGRFVEQKHPEQVLRLARERPDVVFKIRGSGPLEDQIVNASQSLENVDLIPKLNHQELADLYGNATATLCPYEREGFGMVAIESMASGTPVIGLDSGNLSSLITPESGELCSTLDGGEWDQAIRQVCKSLGDYDPRSQVEEYAWGCIAKKYRKVYAELLDTSTVTT